MISDGNREIALGSELTLREGPQIVAQLLEALDSDPPLLVDCSDVVTADTGGLQLLVSAQKTAAARARTLRIRIPAGGAVARALDDSGIAAAEDCRLVWAEDLWTGLADGSGKDGA